MRLVKIVPIGTKLELYSTFSKELLFCKFSLNAPSFWLAKLKFGFSASNYVQQKKTTEKITNLFFSCQSTLLLDQNTSDWRKTICISPVQVFNSYVLCNILRRNTVVLPKLWVSLDEEDVLVYKTVMFLLPWKWGLFGVFHVNTLNPIEWYLI